MKRLMRAWSKFWEWVSFCYWDGLSGGALSREKEVREHVKKNIDQIRKMQKAAGFDVPTRYGCPQDYKNVQDFIDSL